MAIDVDYFRQHRQYAATKPLPGILADLQSIAELDRCAQQQTKRLTKVATWYFLGMTGAILLTIFSVAEELWWLMGIGTIAAATNMTGFWVYRRRLILWDKLDVPDFRHQLPKQVLDLVKRDMDPEAPVAIALDFNPSMIEAKRTSSGPHPLYSGLLRDSFADQWMTLKGQFLDGTTFDLAITERWSESSGYKTSQSGKRKYKRKTKTKGVLLGLLLEFSRKRYGAVSMLKEDVLSAIRLPDEYAQVKSIRVSDRKLLLQVNLLPDKMMHVPPSRVYPAIASMFLSLYHVLNLAQALSKVR